MAKIIENFDNKLLKRKQVKFIVEHPTIPHLDEARKIVAEEFKESEDAVAVKNIKGKFGRKTFLITANIYDSIEDKKQIEPKSKKEEAKKEKPAEEPKPEEKPAEEKIEDGKKEEVSEEGKEAPQK